MRFKNFFFFFCLLPHPLHCGAKLIAKQQKYLPEGMYGVSNIQASFPPPPPWTFVLLNNWGLKLPLLFWSPVTGESSINSSPRYFTKPYIPRKFAGAPVGRLCWAICKAGWWNQLFVSTKCIRWKIEWPIHDVSSSLETWIVVKYSWGSVVCDSVIISCWWMVWYLSKLGWGVMATLAKWWY